MFTWFLHNFCVSEVKKVWRWNFGSLDAGKGKMAKKEQNTVNTTAFLMGSLVYVYIYIYMCVCASVF